MEEHWLSTSEGVSPQAEFLLSVLSWLPLNNGPQPGTVSYINLYPSNRKWTRTPSKSENLLASLCLLMCIALKWSHSVALTGLKLLAILRPWPSQHWDYKHMLQYTPALFHKFLHRRQYLLIRTWGKPLRYHFKSRRGRQMSLWGKASASEPENPSAIPGTHMVEWQNDTIISHPPHMHVACVHTHTYT